MLFRVPLSWLSPAGPKARLSILIFHRVLAQPDPLFPGEVDTVRFDRICSWVSSMFKVLPLDEAVARQATGSLPSRSLSITFDDGYADNHEVALPILQRHGLTATFFIATGFLDGGRMWNDTVIEAVRRTKHTDLDLRVLGVDGLGVVEVDSILQRRAAIEKIISKLKYRHPVERLELVRGCADISDSSLPDDLMMSSGQVRMLREAGMQIGAHTVTHPILASVSRSEVRREIADSRDVLEGILSERVGLFAYPNGKPGQDYNTESVDVVRELGFDAAVTTHWGAARSGSDRFQLPRFSPWDLQRTRFGLRMMRNLWGS